jgi:hypothetical protein
MEKKLLVLGDSFCHGIGTASVFKDSKNTEHAFGRYVADYLELDYLNLAEPGISIQRTIEIGYRYLSQHQQDIDTVVIGWTNPSRAGFYTQNSMLQILPNYVLLGDNSDLDVFVEYKNDVKFVTDKRNQLHLSVLPQLHKIMIENNFIDQTDTANMLINFFKLWLDSQKIKYYDFSVFGHKFNTKLSASFNNVMTPTRHPTADEQQKFAEILIQQL